MQEFIDNVVQPYFNYWTYAVIMMIGLWGLIAKKNLIKKLIGMSIFQTAIILFYVSIGVKDGATIPVKESSAAKKSDAHGEAHYGDKPGDHKDGKHHGGGGAGKYALHAPDYANPLPHVLMLTAIVVGVSTLGVALAVSQSIFKDFGTLEEDEILEQIKAGEHHD